MSKILEEEIYGKVATPKKKIIGEFIEKYVILSLIPWIIYRIGRRTIFNKFYIKLL